MIERTIHVPQDADFRTLYQVSLAEWQGMPTLHSGQFDNLKFESATFRVWTSRLTLADYDGNLEAYAEERLTIEKMVNGLWCRLDRYGRLKP